MSLLYVGWLTCSFVLYWPLKSAYCLRFNKGISMSLRIVIGSSKTLAGTYCLTN